MLPTCLHHDENRQKTYVSSTKGFLFPSHVSEDCCSYQFWMTIDQLTIFGWNISKFILTKEMWIQNKKFQIRIHHWFKNENSCRADMKCEHCKIHYNTSILQPHCSLIVRNFHVSCFQQYLDIKIGKYAMPPSSIYHIVIFQLWALRMFAMQCALLVVIKLFISAKV